MSSGWCQPRVLALGSPTRGSRRRQLVRSRRSAPSRPSRSRANKSCCLGQTLSRTVCVWGLSAKRRWPPAAAASSARTVSARTRSHPRRQPRPPPSRRCRAPAAPSRTAVASRRSQLTRPATLARHRSRLRRTNNHHQDLRHRSMWVTHLHFLSRQFYNSWRVCALKSEFEFLSH